MIAPPSYLYEVSSARAPEGFHSVKRSRKGRIFRWISLSKIRQVIKNRLLGSYYAVKDGPLEKAIRNSYLKLFSKISTPENVPRRSASRSPCRVDSDFSATSASFAASLIVLIVGAWLLGL